MQLGQPHEGTFNGSPTLDPELLLQELRSGRSIVVVDIRNKDEFQTGHIEGSRSIPIHQLVARACELDRNAQIIIVSWSGIRARIAAASLRLAGYPEVASLAGGIKQWRDLAYPLECTTAPASRR